MDNRSDNDPFIADEKMEEGIENNFIIPEFHSKETLL